MNLTINNDILALTKDFNITAYHLIFTDDYNSLIKTKEVDELIKTLPDLYQDVEYENITKIPKLKETRDGYKAYGKDPSHTRPACEALLRRIVKGKELYRLGDVIDLGNVLSIMTLRSVCVVDYSKLKGDLVIRMGKTSDIYQGLGRDLINVENIPVYCDAVGPFGCPTSDNERTKVDEKTKEILIMIINFSHNEIEKDEEKLLTLFKKYTKIKNIEKLETKL